MFNKEEMISGMELDSEGNMTVTKKYIYSFSEQYKVDFESGSVTPLNTNTLKAIIDKAEASGLLK